MLPGTSLAFLSIHLISMLVMVFFATLVLLHDRKSLINKIFAVMMFGFFGWALSNIGTFNVSPGKFEVVLNFALIFASIQTLSGSAFVYLFPKPNFRLKSWHKVAAIIFTLFFLGVSPLQYDVDQSVMYPNSDIPIANPNVFNVIWGIGIFAQVVFTIAIAISKYRKAKGDEKRQLGSILIGSSTTFALLFVTQYLTVNVLKTPALNSYGPLFMLPIILGTSYAITRYHLFNVKAITTEIITFTLWLFLLLRILFDKSLQDYLVDGVILLSVVIVGIFLIKSVLNEVKQKEKLAELNAELDKTNASLKDLNEHLEQKVAEQTVEVRQAYEVEKKARVELEELDKAKDQFILTTQHHLRTPLTIVKGYIQSLFAQKKDFVDEELRGYLLKSSEATDQIATLVNKLLDISQMEVGKSILNKEAVDVRELIQGIANELKQKSQALKLDVIIKLPDEFVLTLDKTKVKEAFRGLIENAIKYNKEGGSITISGEIINHPIEKDRKLAKVVVEDTGVGIAEGNLAKVFSQTFDAENEGVGLTVTKDIIVAHNGRIWVESRGQGKGSKFIVELPL